MLTRLLLLIACGLTLVFSACRPVMAGPIPRRAVRARVLFFVAHDCPIANGYAPEIKRIAAQYAPHGVQVSLVYAETSLSPQAAARHEAAYGYHLPDILDPRLALAHRLGVTVTPEAVVLSGQGRVLYRGRIDDKYIALGQPRFRVTRHDLRDALNAVLGGRAVPHPVTQALGCSIASDE